MKEKLNTIKHFSVTIAFFCAVLPHFTLSAQCPGLGSITLNVSAAPEPVLNGPAELCPGASGTVSVTPAFSSYAWNVGGSGPSISINNPGTFTVTVTNAGGCTGTESITVAPSVLPTPAISADPYSCNGQVVLNAGGGFSSYAWSNSGGAASTATFTSAGTYTVTVTNAAGCTGTDDFLVTIPTPPVVNITGTLNFCSGLSTNLNATPGFSNYAWTGGGSGPNLNVATGGPYTVTATDAFGCTDIATVNVVENPSPTPTVANGQVCPGGTFALTVNNGPFSGYSWTGGGAGSSILVGSGTYTVTVTAANGCTGTTAASVTNFPAPSPNITAAAYACNGQITLDANGGGTYSWTGGAVTPSITVSTPGLYTVTVTNSDGCTGTDNFNVVIPTPPAVNITGDNDFCDGLSASLTASPGLVLYAWSTSETGPTISVSNGGTYTVTATDNFGCTTTDNFVVTELASPQPVITGPVSVCSGINATLSTTTAFPNYSWSNGSFTPTITVNTSNTYVVTVTAANGCTGTDAQAVNVIPAPIPDVFESSYLCDGQLTLNAAAGFTSYAWSNAGSGPSITVSSSGNYTVTVTTAQGCTASETYFAAIPVNPTVQITGTNTICPGTSTTLNATPGYLIYQWSNTANTPSVSITSSGNYTVTVTDGLGCTATAAYSVSALPAPTPTISGPSQICATGNAVFSVPGTYAAYSWSNGASSPTISVNIANTYAVTVTAANGCTGTDAQTLVVANSLQPQITESPYACTGQVTLDAGTGFATYLWSNAAATPTIVVTLDDTYTVTVSDAGGCTGSASFAVTIPPAPVVNITGPASACAGASTPITATPGLNTYIWSTTEVGPTINVTTAGTYTVTVTDVFGCSAESSFIYNTVSAPQPVITGPAVICTNSSGVLSLNGTFTTYNWSTGESSPTITVTTGNTYGVTVSNATGCTGTDTQVVTTATGLSPVVSELPYTCNGTQTLDAGSGFTTYLWSNTAATSTITVNTPGTYTVTVTDGTGCTGTGSLDVIIPAAPVVAISGTPVFCENASTVLTATAGFAGYSWTGGPTTESLTVNLAGTYGVTVTDAFGCTDEESITVATQPLPQPVIAGPTAVCAGNAATFVLNQAFSSYIWSDGTTSPTASLNTSGTITVTVTDNNGCPGSDDITLVVNNNPAPAIVQQPYTCNGQITLDATAGFSSYAWSNTANTPSINVNQSGTFTLTVTDANGCTGTVEQTVTVPPVTQVTITGPAQFCNGNSTTLVASTGFSTYTWSTTSVLQDITVFTPGTYQVTATDAIGCTSTAELAVSLFPAPAPVIAGPQTVCPGNTANLSVGGSFTGFIWSSGETTNAITVTPPYAGAVTVTDANGCTGSASANVVISNQLTPVIVEQPYNCDGQITLDAGAGFPNYAWSTSGTTSTISVSQSGTFTVTVSDGGGCSGTASITVNLPVQSVVAITGVLPVCPGGTTDLSATSGFVTYAWSNTGGTPTITGVGAGSYTVTVTDGLGCTATAGSTVTTLTPPAPVITGPTVICGSTPVSLTVNGTFTNILWSTTEATAGITVNAPGTFTVTVTDNNGCTGTTAQTIVPGGSISPVINTLTYNCDNQLSLDAGSGYSTYLWNTGATTSVVNVNQSGTYTVTATDANGCSGTAIVQATVPATVVPQVYFVPELCPGASITSIVTNGQNYVAFQWNTGWNANGLTGVIGGQTYTVTVTDANGCTQSSSFSIALAAEPLPVVVSQPYNCDGQVDLDAGAGFSSYLWSNGGNTATISVTQSGTYTVTVSNIAGCTGSANVQATIPANPVVVITGQTSICTGSSTDLSASSGFTGYSWSTGSNQPNITIAQAGTYTVTVTTADGCTATASTTITTNGLTPALQSNEVICEGVTVTITVVGVYASYVWPDGSSSNSLTVLQPGIYTVTVTDLSGCTGTASTEVLAVPPATVDITQAGTLCGQTGATLTAAGSVGTFAWNSGTTGPDLAVTQPGTYTVTITDANGCTATDTAIVAGGEPVYTTINTTTCDPNNNNVVVETYIAANGCDSIVEYVPIYQPGKPGQTIDLGPTLNVNFGEQVSFDVIGNFPIDSVSYQSPYVLSCDDCFSPTFIASASGVIDVIVFDPDGCLVEGQLLVRVGEEVEVFVPNIIQPGSQDNGFLSVFSGPGITFVRNFSVFDRWGNALFVRDDMPTNDPSAGWDGTFRNKAMQPGVYVWYFEIILPNGNKKVFKGDVTIAE